MAATTGDLARHRLQVLALSQQLVTYSSKGNWQQLADAGRLFDKVFEDYVQSAGSVQVEQDHDLEQALQANQSLVIKAIEEAQVQLTQAHNKVSAGLQATQQYLNNAG